MSALAAVVEAWRRGERELAPITALLGVRPVSLGDGKAVVELRADARLRNAMRTLHGGGPATSSTWRGGLPSPP